MDKDRRHVLINGAAMALGFILPIFILLLIQETSGDFRFNELMVGVSYSAYLFVLIDYGQSIHLVVRNNKSNVIEVFLVRLILFVLVSSVWLCLQSGHGIYTIGLMLVGLGSVINTQWLWHKYEKFISFSVISNINKLALILMIIVSLLIDSKSLFLLFSIAHFFLNLTFLILSYRQGDFEEDFMFKKLNLNPSYLLDGLLFYISRISASYYNMLLIPIASTVLSGPSLTTFIVAERFYQLVLASVQPVLNMLNTSLRKEFTILKWRNWFVLSITGVGCMLFILNLYGSDITKYLGYEIDTDLFYLFIRWFSIIALLSVFSMFNGHPILSVNGLHWVANLSVILSMCVFIFSTQNITNINRVFIALATAFGLDTLIRGLFVLRVFKKWS